MGLGLARGEAVPLDEFERQRSVADSLVPDAEDEDWSALGAVTRNAAAAAAHAVRAWLVGETQEAV